MSKAQALLGKIHEAGTDPKDAVAKLKNMNPAPDTIKADGKFITIIWDKEMDVKKLAKKLDHHLLKSNIYDKSNGVTLGKNYTDSNGKSMPGRTVGEVELK